MENLSNVPPKGKIVALVTAGVGVTILILCLTILPGSKKTETIDPSVAAKPPAPAPAPAPSPAPNPAPTPAAPPAPKPEEPPKSVVYTVQSGDSLSAISQRFYGTDTHARAVYEANRKVLGRPNLLKAGIQLVIPPDPADVKLPEPPAAPADKNHYVVQFGDSLWKIASHYDSKHVCNMIERIVEANRDKLESSTTPLQVGWELVIPQ
jgi:nucleoid-associated protein YgaU